MKHYTGILAALPFMFIVATTGFAAAPGQDTTPAPSDSAMRTADLDWELYMAQHDPIWTRLPASWWEAPYLGNGLLGTLIRKTGEREVEFQVGRSDVEDHRPIKYGLGRLPIGAFHLSTKGDLVDCTIRLDLLKAEARGMLRSSAGKIQFFSLVHAEQDAILIAWKGEGNESGATFTWSPKEAIQPRLANHLINRPDHPFIQEWTPNPDAYQETVDGNPVWIQPLQEGGYATAWRATRCNDWNYLWISTAYAWPGQVSEFAADASRAVNEAAATPMPYYLASHRAWWRRYYAKSFFSVSDPYWQSFYWNQLYKLAAATRRDSPILDLQGPWAQETPWPGMWWNLNVELTYWPMYTGNRLELAEALPRNLQRYLPNLISNVAPEYQDDSAALYRSTTSRLKGGVWYPSIVGKPGDEKPETGNLLWACHTMWLHYRMSMDDHLLRETLFPILRRAVNYHRHFLEEGEDGRLHLPQTYSPEYKTGPDCNYDLALLCWGVGALLKSANRLEIEDPLIPVWQGIQEKLTDYPEDPQQGFLIARDLPMDSSHRHYSHLLMAYPLYLVNAEQPGGAARIKRSLEHWHSFPDALFGYSFTGGASIAAALRDGDLAYEYLNGFRKFIEPNTMYREAGPVIETPLSAAQSIHDMLLQSWEAPDGPLIRIFPAVPETWPDVMFHHWRAEGAFLVSAAQEDGQLAWLHLTSLAGEPCRIQAAFSGTPLVAGEATVAITAAGEKQWTVPLREGESMLLVDPAYDGTPAIAPVPGSSAATPVFGLH